MDKQKPTQSQIIKAHLLKGEPITTWQAIQLYHITSLATRISELRRLGLQIEQERIDSDNTHWQMYWLDSDYIESYKARGGDYE